MHKVNTVTYYESELIPSMQFDTEEDAELFDRTLEEYVSNEEALQEFRECEENFPSYYAIQHAINQCEFHIDLDGEYSEKLIDAAENMATRFYDDCCDPNDCYTPVMNYIFGKLHPKINEKLSKV